MVIAGEGLAVASAQPGVAVPVPPRSAATQPSRPNRLYAAIVHTVAYADIFDWPLTPAEIHRFLPVAATLHEVLSALAAPSGSGRMSGAIVVRDGLAFLRGRERLVEARSHRAAASARLWPRAVRAAHVVASLPFVRLVAITGSLAVSAASDEADVDLFVVTEDGRLWLTRALTIGVVRAAATRGIRLCPNYFLAESALEIRERDLFTAHELAQMVPLAGSATYHDLLARNAWYRDYLPNHVPADVPGTPGRMAARALLEWAGRTGPLDRVERWEMRRKVRRFAAGATSLEQRFDESVCKGHFDEHRRRVLAAFQERLAGAGWAGG